MKKILFLMIALFAIPTCILATNPSVKTLEMTNSNGTIKYNGTTEDGVYAVMCKLYNSKEEEIDMLSSSVDSNKFEGSFTVTEKGDYQVSCANYDGGEFKKSSVNVQEVANPKTIDNVVYYVVGAIIGFMGLGIIYRNKKRMN